MKREEIRQNGETILYSDDGVSIRVIFNNLTGRNFDDRTAYRYYVHNVALAQMGFSIGEIELVECGRVIAKGYIRIL
ncbi:hypothetical protein AAAZ59_05095 [Alistipes putredinis]|uniref:DUF7688 family protein n=1 Tax=Alistipes putredinis TaxID=28117 RepID=UPI0032BF57CC